MDIRTIGSMFRFYARSTINGPKNTPTTLKTWINAAAVDCISTVNAYVCIHERSIKAAAK